MSKRVIVELVKFESVAIDVPSDFTGDILDLSYEQVKILHDMACQLIHEKTGESGWNVIDNMIYEGSTKIIID